MLILHTAFLRDGAEEVLQNEGAPPREAAADWLRACESAGGGALLLEGALPVPLWAELRAFLRPPSASFLPLAMRPPLPAPPWLPRAREAREAFLPAAADRERRERAVGALLDCFPLADELDCRLWVLRLGTVSMPSPMAELAALWRKERLPESEEGLERARAIAASRAERGGPERDAARRSLERLFPAAERFGVTLCLENRWDVRGYPTYRELAELLREFAGAPLGYWHNAGHASVHAQLGLIRREAVLERLGAHLRGGTLHDALGPLDHLPPGEGRGDFAALRAAAPEGLPWAVDVRRRRRGAPAGREAAEQARWAEERRRRGRSGFPRRSEEEEETAPAEAGAVAEAVEAFREMGF